MEVWEDSQTLQTAGCNSCSHNISPLSKLPLMFPWLTKTQLKLHTDQYLVQIYKCIWKQINWLIPDICWNGFFSGSFTHHWSQGNSEEQFPKYTVGRLLANSWPTDSQPFVLCLRPKCWPTVSQQSADSRWPVGNLSVTCWWPVGGAN